MVIVGYFILAFVTFFLMLSLFIGWKKALRAGLYTALAVVAVTPVLVIAFYVVVLRNAEF